LEHLTAEKIEQYNRRALSLPQMQAVAVHLSKCLECRKQVGQKEQLKDLFVLMRSELKATTEKSYHLEYEQLAAYIDDKLDKTDCEIVESHLELCQHCAKDMENLRLFKSEMATYPAKEYAQLTKQNLWDRLLAFWNSPTYSIPIQVVSMAAVVLVIAWVATLPLRTEVAELKTELTQLREKNEVLQKQMVAAADLQSELARLQQDYRSSMAAVEDLQTQIRHLQESEVGNSVMVVLNDGDREVKLDRQGNLYGLKSLAPPYQEAVKLALQKRQIKIPRPLAQLSLEAETLMGSAGNGVSFALFSPVGTVVKTNNPTFRWDRLSGAAAYIVNVYDSNFRLVARSEQLTETVWTMPESLERGRTYIWKVTALKDGKEIISPLPPAPEAKFKVLEKVRADELERVKQINAGSHLITGILYAEAGLFDDAELELTALRDANPGSPVAQKLLQSVKSLRQK
jgi:hypothetical protein